MGSKLSNRMVPSLAALALAVTPAAAAAGPSKDYSKNGATGDYTPAIVHKNYSLNGATGDYAATSTTPVQPGVRIVRVTESRGFAWSDAGVGAASVLLATLLAGLGTRRIRQRRIAPPSPARPTAI
jgi:hypothetical protein